MPVEPIQPDQRHPIRRRQPARVNQAAQPFVILALHHGVHGADVDVLRIPVGDPLLDLPDGLLQVDGTYADTQYVDAGESHNVATNAAIAVRNLSGRGVKALCIL